MFTSVRVNGMGYYDRQMRLAESTALNTSGAALMEKVAEAAGVDKLEGLHENGDALPRRNSDGKKGELDYYGQDDTPGRWWNSRSGEAVKHAERQPIVQSGATVTARELKMLAAGMNPLTGDRMRKAKKSGNETVGVDCQLSIPKSASGYKAVNLSEALTNGNADAARNVQHCDEALWAAVNRTLEYIRDHNLIITRQGKGGKVISSAEEMMAAQYKHGTSRSCDPHDHIHSVFMNVCVRHDGTTGTIDNYELLRHVGEIAAIFRCEYVKQLSDRIPELAFERDDRNFKILGFPEDLSELWSKRTNTIADEMEERGWDKSKNRDAATNVNRNTRQDKSEQPSVHELATGRWIAEVKSLGHSYNSIMERVAEAKVKQTRERDEAYAEKVAEAAANGIELPAERPAYDLEELTSNAVKALTTFNAVFEERIMKREIFEELQIYVGADEAEQIYDRIIASGKIVQIGVMGKMDEPVFSTPEIIELERQMLRDAVTMKGNVQAIDPALVEAVIAAGREINSTTGERAQLRDEQAAAVRHLCGPDQLTVMEGRAGAGKSFTYGTVTDILHAAGFEVHGLAPSWKATGVLKDDTKLAEDYARAITGWINRVEKGEIKLDAKTAIIVDEAGMVGHDHMSRLITLAKAHGCRLLLAGDPRQLQPVTAGAPMKAIAELNGSAILQEIARQKIEWQRENSMALSNGDIESAFRSYRMHGNIELHDSGKQALDALVRDYMESVRDRPHATRFVQTPTNRDARTINLALREELKEVGLIAEEDFDAITMSRGKNGKPSERKYAVGDRIQFGETLTFEDDERIINNSLATVLELKRLDDGELLWMFRMDDGRVFCKTTSELVGYRDEKSNERFPKIEHGFAATIHSGQGVTVDENFIFNGSGLTKEAAYVAWTRHRYNSKMYVDASRIHDKIAAQRGVKMNVSRGDAKTKEMDAAHEGEITEAEIMDELIAETSKSAMKLNVCDFQADKRTWVMASEAADKQAVGIADIQGGTAMTYDKKNDAAAFPDFGQPNLAGFTTGAGAAANDSMKPEAEQIEQPAPVVSTPKGKRAFISKGEMDFFVRYPIGDYLASQSFDINGLPTKDASKVYNGWVHVNDYMPMKYNPATKLNDMPAGKHAAIWQCVYKGESAGKVSVLQMHDDTYYFATLDKTVKGRLFDLVSWRKGSSQMESMHTLRAQLGTSPNMKPQQVRAAQAPQAAPKPQDDRTPEQKLRDQVRSHLAQEIEAEKGGRVYRAGDYKIVDRRWNAMGVVGEKVSEYLEKGRGIVSATQRHFAKFIRLENSNQNPGGVCFSHTTLAGQLTGYERKGPTPMDDGKRSFSMFASSLKKNVGTDEKPKWEISEGGYSNRRLGLMRTSDVPSRIYVSEVQIDGLSIWQADGSDKKAWIASTFGSPSKAGLHDLYKLAQRFPDVEFHVATDNDTSGRDFAIMIETAIQEARGQQAKVIDRAPNELFKDWNDQIRGKVWTKEERQQDDNKTVALEAERQQAAQERQRQAEANRQPQQAPRTFGRASQRPSVTEGMTPEERRIAAEERQRRTAEYEAKQKQEAEEQSRGHRR